MNWPKTRSYYSHIGYVMGFIIMYPLCENCWIHKWNVHCNHQINAFVFLYWHDINQVVTTVSYSYHKKEYIFEVLEFLITISSNSLRIWIGIIVIFKKKMNKVFLLKNIVPSKKKRFSSFSIKLQCTLFIHLGIWFERYIDKSSTLKSELCLWKPYTMKNHRMHEINSSFCCCCSKYPWHFFSFPFNSKMLVYHLVFPFSMSHQFHKFIVIYTYCGWWFMVYIFHNTDVWW